LQWSILKYGLEPKEDLNVEEETQAGGDCQIFIVKSKMRIGGPPCFEDIASL